MELTKNFNTSEFVVSKDYPEIASEIVLSSLEALRLKLLCQCILQPLRNAYGVIKIVSGKRNEELNRKVNGVATSGHLTASACDFTCGAYLPDVYESMKSSPYRQLILHEDYIHVSINIPGKNYKHEAWIK